MVNVDDELIFLERLLLKVGTVDGDEELERCLSTLLPQALARLANPTDQVRNKVVELLTHINKRLKSRSRVQLPLDTLLNLYLDPASSAFIVNFTVIYIKLGFPRAAAEIRAELLPLLIKAAEDRPHHTHSLIYLAVGSLEVAKMPSAADAIVGGTSFLGLDKAPRIASLLLSTIHNILLFPYGFKGEGEPPPELSKTSCDELLSNLPIISKGDSLEQMKVQCVRLVSSGVYTDSQAFPLLVIASADPRSSVFNLADAHLRKISGSVNLNGKDVMSPLYSLYMGSNAKDKASGATSAAADNNSDNHRGPASIRLRLKLLPYMSKSQLIIWPTAIQVLFDSLYGENTNSKLRTMALTFCLNMLKQMTDVQLGQCGEVLLRSGLLQLLSSDWTEPALLRQVFPCIGLLVSRSHSLASPNLLQNLFTALINERDRDVGSSLRDCLVTMSVAYTSEDSWLEDLINEGLSSRSSLARLTALHYLAFTLPSASVNRVYLLLQASNHQDEEVRLEAKKALYSGNTREGNDKLDSVSLPDFASLLTLVLDRESKSKHTSDSSRLLTEMVSYLRLCLAKSSGCKDMTLEQLSHPCDSSPLVSTYLRSLESSQPGLVPRYLDFILRAIRSDIKVEALGALVELLGCLIDTVKPLVHPSIDKFMSELGHSKEEVRRMCGHIIGLASDSDTQHIQDLMETAVSGSDVDRAQGCLMAAAYMYESAASRHSTDFKSVRSDLLLNAVSGLLKESAVLVSGWCFWLGLAGRCSVLPLALEDQETLVENLFSIIFSKKHTSKVKERAVYTAGMLCVGDPDFPLRKNIIQRFIDKTQEIKDVELVLSIGEALVACVLGPTCDEGRDPWTRHCRHSDYKPEASAGQLLDLLLSKVSETHPSTRQCCCFWLLSMAKHCSHVELVKSRLDDVQNAFMELLSDPSSLVQEASSKGLALVYSSGNVNTMDRAKLVQKLVEQLTTGKRSVSLVNQDTKLFEEGELGKAPTGGNLSTYKELCSLASDLNQPDLIYKFMNLANHNSLWNSKKGAAFGVGTLLDLAAGEMDSHLPKIIPKLYRYQYDPTPGIQQSMSSIWQALTSNIPNVLERFGKEIYMDLIPSITSGQYRVRQSSCKALSDFIRSAPAQNVILQVCVDQLSELWTQLMRVMDDVHEQTREAATSTTKTLTRMCVRQCEKSAANRQVIASAVLPVLLEKGVTSTVSEVRNLSAEALCSFIKVGVGESEVVRLVPALLSASQHLDYNSLSHLSTMVSGSEAAQEVVDSVRVSAIKSHFTVQTLSRCVEYVKEPMLQELLPHLVENLKSNVGLGTRLATCHFITLLSHTMALQQIQPYIGKMLGALLPGISDRNGAVRKQYATTIGQLSKYAKDSSIDRLLDKLRSLYFDKQDDGIRMTVGHTLQAMLNYNQEAIKARTPAVLPLAFYAKHQIKLKDGTNDKIISVWEEVCDDLGGGSGLMNNSSHVISLLIECLSSTAWNDKAQAGRGIKSLASKVGDSLNEKDVEKLVSTLTDNLGGRFWDGKEALLHALASLAKQQDNGGQWLDVLERECSRGNMRYRCEAVRALGDALASLNQKNISHNKFPALLQINRKILSNEEQKDEDEEEDKDVKTNLIQTSLEAIGKSFPSDIELQKGGGSEVIKLAERLETSTRAVQTVIMSTLVSAVDKLHPTLLTDSHLDLCLSSLKYTLGVPKNTALRKEALNLILILLQRLDGSSPYLKKLEEVFLEFKETLDQDISSEVRTRLADIKQAFGV